MSFTFINLTCHTNFLMSARRRANDFVFDMNCYEEIFKMCWNIGTLEHWNNFEKKNDSLKKILYLRKLKGVEHVPVPVSHDFLFFSALNS
jgi:hypothetical protein